MKRIIVSAIVYLMTLGANAQFSGHGSGTEQDPYLVSNADELFEVHNDMYAYYKQTEDIDISDWIKEDNATQGWNPIGTSAYPFRGHYDGNMKTIKGLFIKRPSLSYVGLFGYVQEATIERISLINPQIEGGENVGAIVGIMYNSGTVSNNIVCGGSIIANKHVGGIVGNMEYIGDTNEYTSAVIGNYICAQLRGEIAGGICGIECNEYFTCPGYKQIAQKIIMDNSANCNIIAKIGGGILGKSKPFINGSSYYSDYSNDIIVRNISQGTIIAEENAGGIIGEYNVSRKYYNLVENNCALLSEITCTSSLAYRICNDDWSGYKNVAYSSMKVVSQGKETSVEDDGFNGMGYGIKTLKRKTTYEGLSYDTDKQWNIWEGESFAYNINQSTPVKISSFVSGNKGVISGTAIGDGVVYIIGNGILYETTVTNGKWAAMIGNVPEGTKAYVCVKTGNLMPSIVVEAVSGDVNGMETVEKTGDSNSDGAVDVADVVSTINHILGKPSSSFNQKNADVNNDGQILVDDAVGTVNIIMNAQ